MQKARWCPRLPLTLGPRASRVRALSLLAWVSAMSARSSASSSSCWALRYLARLVFACCSWGHRQAGSPFGNRDGQSGPTPSQKGSGFSLSSTMLPPPLPMFLYPLHLHPQQEGRGGDTSSEVPMCQTWARRGKHMGSPQRQSWVSPLVIRAVRNTLPAGTGGSRARSLPAYSQSQHWEAMSRGGIGLTVAGLLPGISFEVGFHRRPDLVVPDPRGPDPVHSPPPQTAVCSS